MSFTKVTSAGIGSTELVTLDSLEVINNASIGGVLTYEDVTNVDSVGIITARAGVLVGSGITLSKDGDVFFTGIATGNGSGLTNLPAANLTGTLPAISGANLTNLDASDLASGTVPTARLGSGTASSSTFLRGDSSFQTVNTDLVSDTSPQLGGNLDVNSKTINLGDSSGATVNRIRLGADNDGDLFHDGTDLFLRESDSGQILLRSDGAKVFANAAGSENQAIFRADGNVELYYDNVLKLKTHSSGVFVSSDANIGRVILGDISGNYGYQLTGYDAAASATGGRFTLVDADGGTVIDSRVAGGNLFCYNNVKLGSGTADNLKAVFGAGDDLEIYHNGTVNLIQGQNSKNIYIQGDDVALLNQAGNQTSIWCNSGGSVQLYYANTERLTTFSEGVDVYVSGNAGLRIRGNAADVNPRIVFRRKNNDGNNSEPAAIRMTYQGGSTHESGHLDFLTNGDSGSAALSVKVRFQNDGVKYFDSTFDTTANNARKSYFTGTGQLIQGRNAHESYIVFQDVSNNTIGSIVRGAGSSIAYNTTSDYRLKENVVDLSDAITRLKTLSPKRFNFKSDPSITIDGFLAHEVTAVPEAIEGEKDAVVTQAMIDSQEVEQKSVGDPIYQGIDQSKLVPLLTAALQEAITKIETLETKVAALEG